MENSKKKKKTTLSFKNIHDDFGYSIDKKVFEAAFPTLDIKNKKGIVIYGTAGIGKSKLEEYEKQKDNNI